MPQTAIEVPFTWTCPKCRNNQTDTVNDELGPFVTATCGKCYGVLDQNSMDATEFDTFQNAVDEALRMGGRSKLDEDEAGEPGDDPDWENLSAQEQRDSANSTIKVVITSRTITP